MELRFEKLTPELTDEFFRFFDNDAFSDHEEWAGCYCLESHVMQEIESKYTREERRAKAAELIQKRIMNGYLIYDGERIVGWCNAGDKADFAPIYRNSQFSTDCLEKGKIKILYCIDIAADYRGKGIADMIIERVLADAKDEGYSFVEGYPLSDGGYPYQYKGPVRLYEKHGFENFRKESWFYIMRKAL